MSGKAAMVEAQAPTDPIRRAYNFYSYFYHLVGAPLERKPRLRGLELADIQPWDKVLEVAVGPGATLVEIVKRVDRDNIVEGVDLSPKMLHKARRHVTRAGYMNIDLREADARSLPFPDRTFDVLYNSYMLDLIPSKDMPVVLTEFSRVLRPGGRLVLVNLSKPDSDTRTWYERFYTWVPKRLVPYVFGGCRPVLMEDFIRDAGFEGVTREYIPHVVPSEVVIARKPAADKPLVSEGVRGHWPPNAASSHTTRMTPDTGHLTMNSNTQAPSLEDVGELSGIETLHPGGLDLSKRIGELVDMRGKRVLEVACGRGVFACYYARHFGARVTGVDVSADMVRSAIRRARKEGVENTTEFKVANGMALPFESNSFDVVISECALGLASDPQTFLNEKARVARLGGYVGLHLSLWLKDIADGERVDMEKRLGGKCFTLSELRTMVSRAGLVDKCSEDWSGVEQLSKIRPDRRAEAIGEVFTVREKLTILWRLLRRFGLKGVSYVNQSVKKITLLHYNGTIGYYLMIAQKPKEAAR